MRSFSHYTVLYHIVFHFARGFAKKVYFVEKPPALRRERTVKRPARGMNRQKDRFVPRAQRKMLFGLRYGVSTPCSLTASAHQRDTPGAMEG